MKKVILLVFTAVLISLVSAPAFAQKPTRITLKSGTHSKVITGTLNGYKSHRSFVIHVKKGQTLSTENAGENYITVGIDPPRVSKWEADMDLSCHSTQEVEKAYPGDYIISVSECMKADHWKGKFRLRITVR